jgi:hypothetical protein
MDLETILPLSLIRTHTKTDDVPSVTDLQLELYRAAAFELAEQYTGKIWLELRDIVEPVNRSQLDLIQRRAGNVMIRQVPVDGLVRLVGGSFNAIYMVEDGSTTIALGSTRTWGASGNTNSCNMCDCADTSSLTWQYRAGPSCAKDIPAGVKLGALQFIAWAIENPGDMMDQKSVHASGAIAQWSQYRRSIGF